MYLTINKIMFLIKFISILILSGLSSVDLCNVEISLPRLPTHEREGAPRVVSVGKLIPKLIPSSSSSPSPSSPSSSSSSTTTTTTTTSTSKPILSSVKSPSKSDTVVCYYGSWSGFRSSSGQLQIENIDPTLCTHLVYTFAGLDSDSKIKSIDPTIDLDQPTGKSGYRRFNQLKKINTNLKTLIGVGGWNEGSIRYSSMAANYSARKIFASSILTFLDTYGFDGVDLAWEFPSARGGNPQDKQSYVTLIRDLVEVLKPKNYLITASVSANKLTIDSGYDVAKLSEYLDLINVLAFDYHGGWEGKTGHHSPLFDKSADQGIDSISNVNYTINYWIERGASPSKLVLGLATFGRSFTIKESTVDCAIGAKVIKPSQDETIVPELGSYGFNQICSMQKNEKWIIQRDPNLLVPFTCKGNQFIGYDDRESIGLKARFARVNGLAGISISSIENDDFGGKCFDGIKFPLIRAAINELKGSNTSFPITVTPTVPHGSSTHKPDNGLWTSTTTDRPWSWTYSTAHSSPSTWWPQPSSTSSPSTWWPQPSSTLSTSWTSASSSSTTWSPSSSSSSTTKPSVGNPIGAVCKYPGTFIHPTDCRKFYRCVRISIEEKYQMYEYDCPPNTLFDVNSRNCLWDYLVNDCREGNNKRQ
uniref:Chitinase 2 n=1 Tax=Panonychus citri TaxID=50023 RepID=A0A1L1WSZ8_PANCT|nr:chitinase 2 [Panonychus citri]